MTETVGKEIMLEGVDPRELYGAQDVYLEQIKSLHPTLKIVARGQSLKVLGPEADTQRFAKRMEGLAAYYVKYGHVSAEVIEQCFAGGIAQDDAPVDKDVIVYGNNGTIVRARTVNQQRLVKLYDRNDLLFAVGPAGSGKTYTAIALAVDKADLGDNYRVTEVTETPTGFAAFIASLNMSVREAFTRSELGLMMKDYNTVREAFRQQGVLMYSPYKVEIR